MLNHILSAFRTYMHGDGAVLLRWQDSFRDVLLLGMARRRCTGDQRQRGPERLATLTTPIPPMQHNDLAGRRLHGDPAPLFVCLLLYKAPHLLGCGFQLGQHDRSGHAHP